MTNNPIKEEEVTGINLACDLEEAVHNWSESKIQVKLNSHTVVMANKRGINSSIHVSHTIVMVDK